MNDAHKFLYPLYYKKPMLRIVIIKLETGVQTIWLCPWLPVLFYLSCIAGRRQVVHELGSLLKHCRGCGELCQELQQISWVCTRNCKESLMRNVDVSCMWQSLKLSWACCGSNVSLSRLLAAWHHAEILGLLSGQEPQWRVCHYR